MSLRPDIEKILSLVLGTALGGLVIGITRVVMLRRFGGWWQWLSCLLAAVLVAELTMLALRDTGLSQSTQAAIIGVATFVSEDILLGIAAIARAFSKDPIGTIRTIWDAVRGRAPAKDIAAIAITEEESKKENA